ncbi:hypothetical protein CERZMDRAFT_89920 [Cercospora zeae-maydis SCOH1-5]|uniref:Uncharacterized protein n=1 Tax=Cercospora zeae-maydis SCOH1-5 TaxID=717836 RepID=A0A6A6FTR7_9PEZI|nr:hypothetical protein CERZMDRAFT_89920 [Cercospora zeae-maydis SCOH1-5]
MAAQQSSAHCGSSYVDPHQQAQAQNDSATWRGCCCCCGDNNAPSVEHTLLPESLATGFARDGVF